VPAGNLAAPALGIETPPRFAVAVNELGVLASRAARPVLGEEKAVVLEVKPRPSRSRLYRDVAIASRDG